MSLFDTYIMVDWSGGKDAGPKPKPDAIWVYSSRDDEPVYMRNRQVVEGWLADRIAEELSAKRKLCIGFDFPFGYPKGFAQAVTGKPDPLAVWEWLSGKIEDTPKDNNRFDVAAEINAMFGGIGPFWGNGLKREIEHLPRKGLDRTCKLFPEKRHVETLAKGSFACWQLSGAGAVGSQVLMGLPVLQRLREKFAGKVAVWPFEPLDTPVAFVEIWPSLFADKVREAVKDGGIKDAHQVRITANEIANMDAGGTLKGALDAAASATEEGWILGVDAPLEPPKLSNDCFALPPGINWTPVDETLERLRKTLTTVVGREEVNHMTALGRIVAQDTIAKRANPPAPNSAVDGYGFAHGAADAPVKLLPLIDGRAAAGAAYKGVVPSGHAIRILTGAVLPQGVDTVVLEEDCTVNATHVAFAGTVKPGSNARKAGEDMMAGDVAIRAGHCLRPQDLALLAALGVDQVPVFKTLRVGVLSTGDELVQPSADAPSDRTYDANRPMLLRLAQRWGYEAVDLGHVGDDRAALKSTLDQAAGRCDVILTSGGASAGDEDHVSALLRDAGTLHAWRIAIKPGRPLALAVWNNTPVFGLPGNPVAAFVCALIFARPAFAQLAGGTWQTPQGFDLPAAFSKSKKPGRREYLRAKINSDGAVEVFPSEGSGRISGLSWSDGLVELPDEAAEIKLGTPVRYLPYASFGL